MRFAIFVLSIGMPIGAGVWAQPKEICQAQPGESCVTKYDQCGDWCTKNRPLVSDKMSCDGDCTRYHGVRTRAGVWSTPRGKIDTRGLTPQ